MSAPAASVRASEVEDGDWDHDGCVVCFGNGGNHIPISQRQMDFLRRSEFEVLFGGAKGGGKSFALCLDVLQHVHHAEWSGLLLRRSMPQLKEIMVVCRRVFPRTGAEWLAGEKTWVWPSGARLELAFCKEDSDVERYQGRSFHWIGIDELGHWRLATYLALFGSIRGSKHIRCYMRVTANPLGIGHMWIRERFIDAAPSDVPVWDPKLEHWRVYLKSLPTDNPFIGKDYLARLNAYPTEAQRRAFMLADWDTIEGTMFGSGLRREIHIVKPFKLPDWMETSRSGDHGFKHPAAFLWDKRDRAGNMIVYREMVQAHVDAYELGKRIAKIERDANEDGVTGPLDPQAWERIGTGVTPADHYHKAGVRWFKARKGPESRKIGVQEMHRRLATFNGDEHGGRTPSIRIFETCQNLVSLLPILEPDPEDPEDTLKCDGDDVWDSLRYKLRHCTLHDAPKTVHRNRHGIVGSSDSLRQNRAAATGY